jgi:hypothetical protein
MLQDVGAGILVAFLFLYIVAFYSCTVSRQILGCRVLVYLEVCVRGSPAKVDSTMSFLSKNGGRTYTNLPGSSRISPYSTYTVPVTAKSIGIPILRFLVSQAFHRESWRC